jgi:hypothetical protein
MHFSPSKLAPKQNGGSGAATFTCTGYIQSGVGDFFEQMKIALHLFQYRISILCPIEI